MREAGVSYANIATTLGIPRSTVSDFLARNKNSDDRKMRVMLAQKPRRPLAPIVVEREDSVPLIEIYMTTERTRISVMHDQIRKTAEELESPELDPSLRLRGRLELIRTLRTGMTLTDKDQAQQPKGEKDREITGMKLVIVRPEPRGE